MGDLAELIIPLSSDEQVALRLYEEIVRAGKMSIGVALRGIRDGRLYRGTHGTFESYCQEEFHIGRNYVNKKIAAAETLKSLGTSGTQTPSERVVRPLTALPPEEQIAFFEEAVESAPEGKVTAKHVQAVVDKHKRRKRIPDYEEPTERITEVSDAMHHVKTAILHLESIKLYDPEIIPSLKHVIKWVKNKIKEVESNVIS